MNSTIHKGITCILFLSTLFLLYGMAFIKVKFDALESVHYKTLKELKDRPDYTVIEIPVPTREYDYEVPESPFDFSEPI